MVVRDTIRRLAQKGGITLCVVALAACDDGVVTVVEDPLNQSETTQLLGVLGQVALSIPTSQSTACPEGGTLTLGQVSTTTGQGGEGQPLLFSTGTLTLDDCIGMSNNGTTFLLNGDVITTLTFELESVGGAVVSLSGSHTGTLDWNIGVRTGECVVDLTSGPADAGVTTIPVEGTLCGISIDTTVTIS